MNHLLFRDGKRTREWKKGGSLSVLLASLVVCAVFVTSVHNPARLYFDGCAICKVADDLSCLEHSAPLPVVPPAQRIGEPVLLEDLRPSTIDLSNPTSRGPPSFPEA